MQLTLAEIARVIGSTAGSPAPSEGETVARGYSIDSRTIEPGELFFAVRGERLDGHDYVLGALERGASGAVVDMQRRDGFPAWTQPKLLAVADTLSALQQLAAEVRLRWAGPVVAVTGSAGKTTTKQTIAALLRTRFRVLESERNLNNHFGLPLSLLRLGPEVDVGVFELGMSAPGEIRLLAKLAAPNVGVVTNVGPVHLEFFADVDAIARAKFELIETLPPGAWAVLNADDPRVRAFADRMPGCFITFGIAERANFQARDLETDPMGGAYFTLPAQAYECVPSGVVGPAEGGSNRAARDAGRDVRFHLPMLGRHNVLNVLSALAVCHAFGIAAATLRDAVAELRPAPMRGEVSRLACGAIVVNDCYNSNPDALEQMLTAVHAIPARRRFAVLGGMKELGAASKSLHQRCGRRLPELGFDALLTVGEDARDILEAACAAGMPPRDVAHFDSPDEAGVYLREMLRDGDVVLLKASRAVHLEKVWDALEPITAPAGATIQESVSGKGAL